MSEKPAESLRKKWIEPVVAVLMALITLCTAWCSYESAAWTRQSNRLMNESNAVLSFVYRMGRCRDGACSRANIAANLLLLYQTLVLPRLTRPHAP